MNREIQIKKSCLLAILVVTYLTFAGCCPPFCPPEPREIVTLSPPTVDPPLYECATALTVQGFVPGATIDIYADGSTRIGGGVSDAPWGQSFSVNPALVAGQLITATQSFEGETSQSSEAVEVVSFIKTHPEGLPKPRLDTPLYECGGAVGVRNLAKGGLLEVFADDNLVGQVNGCGSGQWLFVNPRFAEDQKVYAVETLCDEVGPRSDEAAVGPAPTSLPAPTVDEVYEGGSRGVVHNIVNGAMVRVYNGTQQIAGHHCSGGGQIFRLNPPPNAGDTLTATQELCGQTSEPSDRTVVRPCSELPAPIVYPICHEDDSVSISGTAVDARIRIYADGEQIGDGGGTRVNLIRPVQWGEVITVTQSLGSCTSPPSAGITVGVDASPPYDPDFWNESSIVGCNNCYNYGCNIRTDTFAQPGYASSVSHSTDCPSVGDAAEADGLVSTYMEKKCSGCSHLVALVIAPGTERDEIKDYHWYRLDNNGRWSHKPGPTPATDRDASGATITDPETADRRYVYHDPEYDQDYILDYRIFCRYYCVDRNSVVIAGRRPCDSD
jgi:hypothetical protein